VRCWANLLFDHEEPGLNRACEREYQVEQIAQAKGTNIPPINFYE
jgi:hypothetical protein